MKISPLRIAVACGVVTSLFIYQLQHMGQDAKLQITGSDLLTIAIDVIIAVAVLLVGVHYINSLRTQAFAAKQLGQYRLTEKIGAGGMGEVWKAEHRFLVRPAAIKLIPAGMVDAQDPARSQGLRRFEREAQSTASLRSAHTIELYDFGIAEDGAFYYVMEYLDGVDLERLIRRFGPLPAARAVYFLRQACESLAEAHEQGLVHRDIKPANIFTCRLGKRCDFVKVLDFGLALSNQQASEFETRLTQDGALSGTPAYMAPEAARGLPLDERSDLYSLGCVGYWLLTGQLVFEANSAVAMAVSHVNDPPTPPSRRTELEIPPVLEKIVLDCLLKDPGSRPQTAEELAERLADSQSTTRWDQTSAREWWSANLAGRAHEIHRETRDP